MIVWRDGDFIEAGVAVSAEDRGWLIGDAVFETVLIDSGAPAFLDRHLERMRRGCAILGIDRRLDADELHGAIAMTAEKNALGDRRAACRMTLSRSGGPRGLAPHRGAQARLFISVSGAAPPPEMLRVILSSPQRWTGASTNGFKCAGAYAENILARAEAASRGANEAIMLNEMGRAACASAANLFVVSDDLVSTPSLADGAMPGVVRAVLMEEAQALGVECREAPIMPADLALGTLLLTNSIMGPVRSALEDLPVVNGLETARTLIAAYQRRLELDFSGHLGARK
jgi:branched-chain amino acid aminotransferase